ncbi:MAG: cytochrome P460 family protein [Halieaceae bacterium]|jgi:hypothetical protein|nr:cytochrome P460 family protein [Halieaceae bacterium]
MIARSLLLAGLLGPLAASAELPPHVDDRGNISLPADFRVNMVHLGTWYVPSGGASGFHDVYTERESVEHFRKTGRFPDGATLVKELRGARSGNYTTGTGVGSATQEVKQWFVMVKDTRGRFPDNALWGDGWGWGLYKTDDPTRNVAQVYKADCIGCHIPAKETDYIYIHAYPTLTNYNF